MKTAKISLISEGRIVLVQAPYNPDMIAELKQVESKLWRPAEKAWSFKVKDEARVREIVAKYFPEEKEEQQEEDEYKPASNIMRHTDVVMQAVRHILYNMNENDGKISHSIINMHTEEFRGMYCTDSANVAMACLGIDKVLKGGEAANEAQFSRLVEMAKKREEYLIRSILRKREARQAAKAESRESAQSKAEGNGPSTAEDKPVRKIRKAKRLSPELAGLQLPEGKTARLKKGQLVVVNAKKN